GARDAGHPARGAPAQPVVPHRQLRRAAQGRAGQHASREVGQVIGYDLSSSSRDELLERLLEVPSKAQARPRRPAMSTATAATRIPPLMTGCQKDSVFMRLIPLSREAMTSAPSSAPQTVPWPPRSEVPPM